tara:strand:+ start:4365 stop:4952 length:588 start_codon:yes stop_codon:yes gene_type:complete
MIKRIFDFLFAFFSLIFLFPFLLIIALLIKRKISNDIFFIQKRAGYKCKTFDLIKFKTMNDNKDEKGNYLPDEMRIGLFGKWLRGTSIDELPSFINIIRGELSFVGPRPFDSEYLKYYNKEEVKRHSVMPGLTGWAQINGRNYLTWEEKFSLDLWYVRNRNFLLDLKIIFITILKVILKKGVNTMDGKSMPRFKR